MQRARMVGSAAFACVLLIAGQRPAVGQEKSTIDAMFRQLDKSGDGALTMDEATAGTRSMLERIFKEAGKGPRDRVARAEFLTAYASLRSKSASAKTPQSAGKSAVGAGKAPLAADKAPPPAAGKTAAGAGKTASAVGATPPTAIGAIDADGDRAISRAEWSKFMQSFKSLDADKDGALSASELEVTGGAAELLLQLADANGDGKIVRAEWIKLSQSFARLDEDRDKSLAPAELQKAADAAVAAASGSASLPGGKSAAKSGPTLWRGRIEGRSQIELFVNGANIMGQEIGEGGAGDSLGAGTFTMTGDGKSGNMDAMYTEGDRAGEVCLGIYKLDGDKLLWCVNNKGGRPGEFKGGGGNWLLTLNRVEAESATATKKGR